MAELKLENRAFRRALMSVVGLSRPMPDDALPSPAATRGPAWAREMIRRLGFVQVDPICVVERAHHHILYSRNRRYRQDDLRKLLEDDRSVFESWTHDAAILPVETYPYWKHYFERQRNFEVHAGYRRYFERVSEEDVARVLEQVREQGPCRPRDLGTRKVATGDAYFAQPSAAKLALEWLWRTGTLAVSGRESRQKVYDLAERVIPEGPFQKTVSKRAFKDWACRESLHRLGAAGPAQIAGAFDAVSTADAAAWCKRRLGKELVQVRVALADGGTSPACYAHASFAEAVADAPPASRGMSLLSPFDPLTRDRRRAARVFGFDYRIEIWVPKAERKYGYYVLPILEGERFTGRVDCKVDRKRRRLDVLGLWWESGVRPIPSRMAKLERELQRLATFVGVEKAVLSRRARAL